MALIIETGAGVANADSYVEIAAADAYHLARGNTAWASASNGNKEIALRNAGIYLDNQYTFEGMKTAQENSMAWPRYGVIDRDGYEISSDVIPTAVKNAQCELALRALSGALISDVAANSRVKSQTVDVISIVYETWQSQQNSYSIVDMLLRGLTVGSGSGGGAGLRVMVLG